MIAEMLNLGPACRLQDDFMKKDINWEEMKAKRQKLENGAASESSNLPIFPEVRKSLFSSQRVVS